MFTIKIFKRGEKPRFLDVVVQEWAGQDAIDTAKELLCLGRKIYKVQVFNGKKKYFEAKL